MKKKPTCSDVFKYICENLDKDIKSPYCLIIKKHLDDCPDCMTYLDGLKKIINLYRSYPDPVLSHNRKIALLKTLNLR